MPAASKAADSKGSVSSNLTVSARFYDESRADKTTLHTVNLLPLGGKNREMDERFKSPPWKGGSGVTPTRVRIPLSLPGFSSAA